MFKECLHRNASDLDLHNSYKSKDLQFSIVPVSRVPGLVWLSAGQLDGMNDNVLAQVRYTRTRRLIVIILMMCLW